MRCIQYSPRFVVVGWGSRSQCDWMDNGDICLPNVESILATGGHGPQPVVVNYLPINYLRSLPKHMVPIGFFKGPN